MDSETILKLSKAAVELDRRIPNIAYVSTLTDIIQEVEGTTDIVQVRYPTGTKIYHYKVDDPSTQPGDWVAVSDGDSNPRVLKVIGKGYHRAYGRNLTVHKSAVLVRRRDEPKL